MKTREIVRLAYRKLGIQTNTAPITGPQMSEGVTALNMMLHGFKSRGVDLAHADLEPEDDFSLPQEFHEGVVYMLAERMSPDYMIPPQFDTRAWWRAMQARYWQAPISENPAELLRLPSQDYDRIS